MTTAHHDPKAKAQRVEALGFLGVQSIDPEHLPLCHGADTPPPVHEPITPAPKIAALQAIARQYPQNTSPAQRSRLLEAFARYSVSTFECSRYLDIAYAPARVLELRHRYGYDIDMLEQPVITESGEVHPLGVYTLIPATVTISAKQTKARERAAKAVARAQVKAQAAVLEKANGAALTLPRNKG
jgi:Helix-turn-helix domain